MAWHPTILFFATTFFALAAATACGETTNPPASEVWAVCTLNSECTLAAKTCCGVCGKPTVGDVDGVNSSRMDEHQDDVCPEPLPCPLCPTENNPNLFASCVEEACVAVDVRASPASSCTADDDCRLRVSGCCECGGSTAAAELIAVSLAGESSYAAMVCDPEQACAACQPIYPADVEAHCASDGHCAVRPASPPICSLPFEAGPCEAAIRVFAFVDGSCVERIYGGCDGNANRFDSVERCMAVCDGQPIPNGCPDGRVLRNACVACGAAGGCGERADICAEICTSNDDCSSTLSYCADGACEAGGCV